MQARPSTTIPSTGIVSSPGLDSEPTKLSLHPITTTSGFIFPSLYSFPPFFTKQPNEQTWSHQCSQWSTLILAYTRHHRIFKLDLSDSTCSNELFHNQSIKRRLNLSTLRSILDSMVSSGTAEYDLKPSKGVIPTSAFIYWKKPDQWASTIYDWVKDKGLTNSIMTFWELTEGGELVETADFYQLPETLLRKALEILTKQGKCQVFRGVGEDGDGVKFV